MGYRLFKFIRFIARAVACCIDCGVMIDSKAWTDSSKPQLSSNALICTTVFCCYCWVFKFVILIFESYKCRNIETISDAFSLTTLFIGDMPKTFVHLLIVYYHTHTIHQNYTGWLILCIIYKCIERIWGISDKYDWRSDEYSNSFNFLYIGGIIIESIAAITSVILAII